MAFGGYKFAGFRVDNSQYATSETRCLAIHAARVRAFLKASGLAGNPWFIDSEKSVGTLDLNVETGDIITGVNNGIIHEFKENNSVKAYSSYFKYSSGDLEGYYYILTMVDYAIGSGDSGHIVLPKASCLQRYGKNYDSDHHKHEGPQKASCFHCFSLDPFSSSLSPADFDLTGKRATRLCSVGTNSLTYNHASSNTGGYVNKNDIISMFGYVIKNGDIIVLTANRGASNSNPFSTATNIHINLLSLNGFSELYVPNDTQKFLQYDIKNFTNTTTNSSYIYDETYFADVRGGVDQILNEEGDPLVDTNINRQIQVFTLGDDLRTYYKPSGAQSTPYCGLQLGLFDFGYSTSVAPFSNSTQIIKGSTNPELLCANVSFTQLSNNLYTPTIDGNLLLVGKINFDPKILSDSANSISAVSTFNGSYYNEFIGWDSSNPDITTDISWPEYNAQV